MDYPSGLHQLEDFIRVPQDFPSTDWLKCHETIKLSIDKMLQRFSFTEWSKIKAYLYNVFPSNLVVNIIMIYLQKWIFSAYSWADAIGDLKPTQYIGYGEKWKFAFRWRCKPASGKVTVIGFICSHAHRLGLGSDGSIDAENIYANETLTPQWGDGEVVLMVIDTQNLKIIFRVAGVLVGRKLESRIKFPLRVSFWTRYPGWSNYGGVRGFFSEFEEVDDEVEHDRGTEVEVLDGLCVSKDISKITRKFKITRGKITRG